MLYSFDHPLFKISPAKQTIVTLLFITLKILIFVLGIFFIFLNIVSLRALGFLILLIGLTQILRHNKSPHDLRFEKHADHQKIDLKLHLTKHTFWFILNTFRKGLISGSGDVQKIFLYHLIKEKDCEKILERCGVSVKNLKKALKRKTSLEVTKYKWRELKEIYLVNLQEILKEANDLAEKINYPSIVTSTIFVSLIKLAHPEIKPILDEVGINFDIVYAAFLMEIYRKQIRLAKTKQPFSKFHIFPEKRRLFNKALTSPLTTTLNLYSQDLTYLARKGEIGFLIGHSEEISKTLDVLTRGIHQKVFLVGEEGSGRKTIVWHIAWLIEYEQAPKELLDYRLVEINLSQFLGGSRDYTRSICQKVLEEIFSTQKIIIFLENLPEIIISEEGKEILAIFLPLLQSNIPIIATGEKRGLSELEKFFNLRDYFEIVEVKPLNREESIIFLTLESLLWEKEHKLIISPQAISRAVSIAIDFIQEKPLPKSAEDLLLSSISQSKRLGKRFVSEMEVAEAAEALLRIPVTKPTEVEKEILLNLEEKMHERLVNQEEAIKEIARVLRTYRTGLSRKTGPIGVFLFVGPTGVGKTETAKVLSKIYFPNSEMLRLDMVEFQEADDVEKLIGSEDGKIIGALTEPIRLNPYRVILLDEFEKTHPNLMKLFLPIFDEGKVKDGLGREVDFRHTIIIATSNAYSEDIKNWLREGLNFEEVKTRLRDKLSQIFSVELLNRFDNIIIYKPLGESELMKIAQIMINDLNQDLSVNQGFTLELTENAMKEIVRIGTDPIFGARPLRRAIDQVIRGEIAKIILEGKVQRGQKILIDFQEKFVFNIV